MNNQNKKATELDKIIYTYSDLVIGFSDDEKIYLNSRNILVKDRYNAEGINRIGTTAVNLLNTIEPIKEVLQTVDILNPNEVTNEINDILKQLQAIFIKYELNTIETNKAVYILNELYFGINVEDKETFYTEFIEICTNTSIDTFNSYKYRDIIYEELKVIQESCSNVQVKDLIKILKTFQEIVLIKPRYCNILNVINLAEQMLLHKEDEINAILLDVFIQHLIKLEQNIKMKAQLTIFKSIITQEFRKIYEDFNNVISNNARILDFIKKYNDNLSSTTYNINMFLYCKSKLGEDRYKSMDFGDILDIFINSMLEDVNYIIKNAMNNESSLEYVEDSKRKEVILLYGKNEIEQQLKFINNPKVEENIYKYQITSFKELFFISRYFILKGRTRIRMCKNCNRYFLTVDRSDEDYCHRKYNGKECKGHMLKEDKRKSYKNIRRNIRENLRKKDERDYQNNNRLEKFDEEFESKKLEFNNSEEKILEWLKDYYSKLKQK